MKKRILKLAVFLLLSLALLMMMACTSEDCVSCVEWSFGCIGDTFKEHEHKLDHREAREPTCQYIGVKEHWYCSGCKKYFEDEAATREIIYGNVYIERISHKMFYHEKIEPTCTSTGLEEYYLCTQCNGTFSNSSGNSEKTPKVLPMKAHDVISVDEEPYKCTEDGVKAHYTCTVCHGLFADEAATRTVTDEELAIPAAHRISTAWSYDDTQHWHDVECEHKELIEKFDHDYSGEDTEVCTVCIYRKPSEGLAYSVDESAGTAKLTGIGTFKGKVLNIPATYQGNPVTAIGESAFADNTDIVSVYLPNSIKEIGGNAFLNCQSITYVSLPIGLTSIGDGAFKNCTALENIFVPSSLITIGNSAFYGCSVLSSFRFGKNLVSIGDSAFYGCSKLKTAELPDGLTSIGNGAFKHCTALTKVTLTKEAKLKSIGDQAFYNCYNITEFVIPLGLQSIGSQAFYYCAALKRIGIPYAVSVIGSQAFNVRDLHIYTTVAGRPAGWASNWADNYEVNVHWGQYGVMDD